MKDPAFLFYSSDFLTGTSFLSNDQIGKYIRLLCYQHQNGRLKEKDMLKICETYDEDIFDKFQKDEDGLYFNARLEDEINKRKAYSESRRNNRKKKETQHQDMNNISLSYVEHMENENVNENINTDLIKKERCFNFKNSLLDLGVELNIVETFLSVRKKKKAVNSELAFTKIKNEIIKSGLTPNEAIKIACENSWKGFEAEWVNNKFQQNQKEKPTMRTTNEVFDKAKEFILNGGVINQ
jgi:uncharacterized protein YdaU (DUF1376 family)